MSRTRSSNHIFGALDYTGPVERLGLGFVHAISQYLSVKNRWFPSGNRDLRGVWDIYDYVESGSSLHLHQRSIYISSNAEGSEDCTLPFFDTKPNIPTSATPHPFSPLEFADGYPDPDAYHPMASPPLCASKSDIIHNSLDDYLEDQYILHSDACRRLQTLFSEFENNDIVFALAMGKLGIFPPLAPNATTLIHHPLVEGILHHVNKGKFDTLLNASSEEPELVINQLNEWYAGYSQAMARSIELLLLSLNACAILGGVELLQLPPNPEWQGIFITSHAHLGGSSLGVKPLILSDATRHRLQTLDRLGLPMWAHIEGEARYDYIGGDAPFCFPCEEDEDTMQVQASQLISGNRKVAVKKWHHPIVVDATCQHDPPSSDILSRSLCFELQGHIISLLGGGQGQGMTFYEFNRILKFKLGASVWSGEQYEKDAHSQSADIGQLWSAPRYAHPDCKHKGVLAAQWRIPLTWTQPHGRVLNQEGNAHQNSFRPPANPHQAGPEKPVNTAASLSSVHTSPLPEAHAPEPLLPMHLPTSSSTAAISHVVSLDGLSPDAPSTAAPPTAAPPTAAPPTAAPPPHTSPTLPSLHISSLPEVQAAPVMTQLVKPVELQYWEQLEVDDWHKDQEDDVRKLAASAQYQGLLGWHYGPSKLQQQIDGKIQPHSRYVARFLFKTKPALSAFAAQLQKEQLHSLQEIPLTDEKWSGISNFTFFFHPRYLAYVYSMEISSSFQEALLSSAPPYLNGSPSRDPDWSLKVCQFKHNMKYLQPFEYHRFPPVPTEPAPPQTSHYEPGVMLDLTTIKIDELWALALKTERAQGHFGLGTAEVRGLLRLAVLMQILRNETWNVRLFHADGPYVRVIQYIVLAVHKTLNTGPIGWFTPGPNRQRVPPFEDALSVTNSHNVSFTFKADRTEDSVGLVTPGQLAAWNTWVEKKLQDEITKLNKKKDKKKKGSQPHQEPNISAGAGPSSS
ncbi:hypothetical protein DL93DRAFT_2161661 [Clavulina sp. PMI_390]|nr:hypothetical protein DL93DRAFT_2161661 [Clavulina sp. PMI_390]